MTVSKNNLLFRYALIASLAIALTLGQMIKLHMHIEHTHDHALSSVSTEHKLDVHIVYKTHHEDDFQDHHLAEVQVTPDSFVKKMDSFDPYILLLLLASFFLAMPKQRFNFRENSHTKLSTCYYLLSPPLRAPPIHSPV